MKAIASSAVESAMIDAKGVVRMLGDSSLPVARLAEDGRLPPPVKIRCLTRWRRSIHGRTNTSSERVTRSACAVIGAPADRRGNPSHKVKPRLRKGFSFSAPRIRDRKHAV